jgi:heptosyltransferase II
MLDRAIRPRHDVPLPLERDVQNLVVIKPCCLGDMLMATPAIRALAQRFSDAAVTVVTDAWTRPAIETSPRIDHLILYPAANPLWSAIQVAYRMRPFKFDVGVSLDRSPATALALWLAGIPVRAGIDSSSRGVGLTHRVTPEKDQHETHLYLAAIRELGIDQASEYPEYYVPDEAIRRVESMLPGSQDRRVVVIHPGGAVNPGVAMLEKRWPATNFGELAALLSQEAGATIVVAGQESDRNAVETLKQFARSPVIDLCGQLSLDEFAAICQRASLYVGNDSGVTHLASAVGTPVVAIFGPTSPNRYRPLGRRVRVCAPEESWSTPEDDDLRSVPRSSLPDIASVPLPTVLNACMELLDGSP